ncbi:MAG: ImmA/IrrE family metallo-endopeptidase, partial [Thermodesulfobacteriota bacterium]
MSYLPKPELVALRVLERIGAKSTPINLLKVAKLWTGLEVAEENIENEGYMIDLGIQGGEIIIRSQNIQTRKNYTLAHELGHWILKKEYAAREGYGENKNKNSSIERWCDQFAAELLMPKDWLMRD